MIDSSLQTLENCGCGREWAPDFFMKRIICQRRQIAFDDIFVVVSIELIKNFKFDGNDKVEHEFSKECSDINQESFIKNS